MNLVTATKSNNTLTILVNEDGKLRPISATPDHPKWTELHQAWINQDFDTILELINVDRIVEKFSSGNLRVTNNGVFYRDTQLTGVDVDRILAFMRQNEPYEPIANYMSRKMANSSRRAINEMYGFLEHKNMPLTPHGTIIAYKGVKRDFYSETSGDEPLLSGTRHENGTIYYGVGETIRMERSFVDDNYKQGCSNGLHAGSLEYAKDWAQSIGGIIVLLEIDPAHVVSVPEDCNCSKLRCCECKVLGVYDGPLPDTYTEDYSDTSSDESTDEDEDDTLTCSACHCSVDECECDRPDDAENEICDYCDENIDECSCGICESCGLKTDECSCDEWSPPTMKTDEGENSDEAPIKLHEQSKIPDTSSEVEFRQAVISEICDQVGEKYRDLEDDVTLHDIGFDSLDSLELLMIYEELFKIEIADEIAEKCLTVGDIIRELKILINDPDVQVDDSSKSGIDGYNLGHRHGTRRRKRVYKDGDENDSNVSPVMKIYIKSYNTGYKDARWDYVKKDK